MKRVKIADMFCGAGGMSTGAIQAAQQLGRGVDLVAVNHWQAAVETHAANHPDAKHLCQDLTTADPRKAVPGGKLDLLLAAPECTHHSIARGGKPVREQSRASAWCVLRWASALQIDRILIENVREFTSWGPIGADGQPLKSRRGETFRAFIGGLKSLGYRVEWRLLNAADYGAATTRERLFIQCVRGRRSILWPEASHAKNGSPSLFGVRQRWRAAREVIDWALFGRSIFSRVRPLSVNTLKRIEAGLVRFGGPAAEPFLVLLRGTNRRTIEQSARSLDHPAPTITTSGAHLGLCQPFIVPQFAENEPRSIDRPLGTITTTSRGIGLCEPFLVPTNYGERHGQAPRCHDVDSPMPTVVGTVTHGVVQPFIVNAANQGGERCYDIAEPLPTVTTIKRHAIVQPFLVPYNGTGRPDVIDDPLATVTSRDRFGLVCPDGLRRDILFRMLQPHELAAAMSFPAGYVFKGNREQTVKMIGNAVDCRQARALVVSALQAG